MKTIKPETAKATPTTSEIAKSIEYLRNLLKAQYGSDYTFTIMGRGQVLAASNSKLGVVQAEAE